MRNSLFPWFVVVPDTSEIEFYKLESDLQTKVLNQINLVSRFIEQAYSTDKINIASIGNIVSQLHVHIVGRYKSDICWPGVVWGVKEFKQYEPDQIKQIKNKLLVTFEGQFQVTKDGG